MYAAVSRACNSHIAQQNELFAPAHVMSMARPFASAPASALVFASSSVFAFASGSASGSTNLCKPGIRKPEVIEWQGNMPSNKATLIGTLVREMRIQYLSSGKIVASSSMKVMRSPQNCSWFYLEFWDDLAEVAAAHLKMGDHIFVSGSVWQEIVLGKDGLERTFAKVVAKDLKFVPTTGVLNYTASFQSYIVTVEKLWNDLFDNRIDWADFRGNKKTERHPDFKHKSLNTSLWIDSMYTPDWVKERLINEGSQ